MTRPLRRVVLPALCLLVVACGGGGPTLPGSSPAPLPEAPGSFTAELTPDGTVLLRWASPAPLPGRAPVTGYAVYLESSGSRPVLLGRTGSLSYRWSGDPSIGLDRGRRYVFHVRAESDIGLSQASASAFVDVPFPPLPPLAPGSLTAEVTANAEALLRWTEPPPSPNRVPVAGYAVYREMPGGDAELLGITDALSYLHPGLMPGQSLRVPCPCVEQRGAILAFLRRRSSMCCRGFRRFRRRRGRSPPCSRRLKTS